MHRVLLLPLSLLLLAGCSAPIPPGGSPPESDAGAVLEPDRDIVMVIQGTPRQITSLPGAEELEVLSPDGQWIAFVSGTTGLAAVWAVRAPVDGAPAPAPLQLTNVGLHAVKRVPGQPPEGFVPVPETDGGLRWSDATTIAWFARGAEWTVQVPR